MKKKGKRFLAVWLVLCMILGMVSPGALQNVRAAGYVSYSGASDGYRSSRYYTALTKVFLTGDQRKDFLNVAISQVGYHEGNSSSELHGGNTKGTGDYTEYAYGWNPQKQGLAWCATFVSWCAKMAGLSNKVLYRSAGATQMKNNMTNIETSKLGNYVPQPGDLIFLKGTKAGKSGHVGIVEYYDNAKKEIHTIEGNLDQSVKRNKRKLSDSSLQWIGVPAYTSASATAKPAISVANAAGGKTITISAVSGAQVWYSLDKGAYQRYSGGVSVKTAGSHSISAYAVKSGLSASQLVSRTFSVGAAPTPSISVSQDEDGVTVTMKISNSSAQIKYSLNGGGWTTYTNPFRLTGTATVRCYGTAAGYADSAVQSRAITITKPSVPELELKNSASCAAVGDFALLSWSSIANAKEYVLNTYKDGRLKDTQTVAAAAATVELAEQGNYSFEVAARNSFGTSEYSRRVSVQVMPDVTVVFQDYDGTPLSQVYTIPYGGAVSAPKAPSRQGYDFQGWDGGYVNVRENTVITALYDKKSYTVRFCDQDGTTVSSQKVFWEESAAAPDMSSKAPAGYKFSGWYVEPASECKDYTKVKSNMVLYAAYAWENADLPVDVEELSVSCTSNNAGQYYQADMMLYCNPDQDMRGRIVVEIKTAAGTTKAVGTQDVTLRAGDSETAVSLKINSSADGSAARVYVLGLDKDGNTAGAYSAVKSAAVEREIFYSDWSDWSEKPPASSDGRTIQTEEKKQYRYNTKQTAVSTTSRTMAGYTLVNTKSSTGSWSAWQDSPINEVNTDALYRQVNKRRVVTKTEYRYFHYCTGNVSGAKYQTASTNTAGNATFQSKCTYHSVGVFNAASSAFLKHSDGVGYLYYPNGTSNAYYKCANTCYRWYRSAPIETKKTQYSYCDTTYVYTFEKVNDWSDWSDEQPSGGYYQAEERTLYRYRTVTEKNEILEQDNTKSYTISGAVDAAKGDLAGKTATVLVYKKTNTDPTQSQMEYVDQIRLGEGNHYSFSVRPKEDPSQATGDFVVSLAIEGATRLVNIDILQAPKPSYRVTFMANGERVSEQIVEENESAAVPEAPKLDGYTFVRWDTSASNVTENLTVEAVYQSGSYAVAYVDARNGTIELVRANYGEPIVKEAPKEPEGYEFTGWDAEKVTGDMVVHAVYRERTYTVTFVLPDKTEEVRTAAYGQGVIPPDTRYLEAPDDMAITGWSADVSWWEVTEDMTVYPMYEYEETAAAPYAVVECGDGEDAGDTIALACDTDGAAIYYTLDGTEPALDQAVNEQEETGNAEEGTHLYTGLIEMTENTSIRAIAVADKMNVSETAELDFKRDADWDVPEEPVIAESITLSSYAAALTAGGKLQLIASVLPATIPADCVSWESSDTAVAEVSASGVVTAKRAGTCTITVTAYGVNSVSAACMLTVQAQQQGIIGSGAGQAGNNDTPAVKTSLKKPVSVKAVKSGKKKIKVRWKKVAGAAKYKIYRADKKKGKYSCIKTIKKGKTVSFVDKSVKKGKTYYYKVKAYGKAEGKTISSPFSSVVKCKR